MSLQHLLIIVTDLEVGGTPTVVREVSKRLATDDLRVTVASMKGDGPVAQQIRDAGIDVLYLDAARRRDLLRVWHHLEGFCKVEGVTDVFSFLVHSNVAAALLKHGMPDLRLVQSVQTTQPSPKWHWLAQRWAAPAADQFVVPTPSVAQAAQQRSAIEADRFVVIPNGLDLAKWRDVKPREFDASDVRIGFLGRLDPVKRVDDLVRACRDLPNVTCGIWGEGIEERKILSLIKELDLGDRVTLHGRIEDPRVAFDQMDVMVLPSEAEGFGLVLLESMASGTPIVTTDAPGIRDVVRHEQTALMTPVGDSAALANAIRRIVSDESLRNRLVEAGRDEVFAKYDWDRIAPKYRELIPPRDSSAA